MDSQIPKNHPSGHLIIWDVIPWNVNGKHISEVFPPQRNSYDIE